jgi:hypothetical protein
VVNLSEVVVVSDGDSPLWLLIIVNGVQGRLERSCNFLLRRHRTRVRQHME